MPLGAGSTWPVAVDADSTLGPTSGIVAATTTLGATGTNQGDLLGIVKNLIQGIVKVENAAQCGNAWCTCNGSFTQPAIGASVTVTTLSSPYAINTWAQIGMIVNVQPGIAGGNIGGYYMIQNVVSSTSVILINLGVGGYNTAAANTVPTGSILSFAGWWNGAPVDGSQVFDKEWEFTGANAGIASATALANDTEWVPTLVGTMTGTTDSTAGDSTGSNAYGIINWASGATAASTLVLGAPRIFIPSLTPLEMSCSLAIPVLSTGSQTYTVGFGICSSSTLLSGAFMGVQYVQATNTFWNAAAGSSVTGATLTSTGVTVPITTNQTLRMALNSGWTTLSVWADHGAVTTVSSGLQTGQMFPIFFFSSTVGTTPKSIFLDRIKLRIYTGR